MNTSDSLVDVIALSLLHFLWQGAAIAALAGTLMLVLRKPATRYLVGFGALVLMLLSFATTVALLSGDGTGEVLSARAPAAALASPKVATATSLEMLWTSQAATSSDAFVWMARAWFAGVFVFALRIVFGLLVIERLRRRSLVALSPRLIARFEALQARLGIDRVIRYCQCEGVSVPAVIGVFRPVVLLPLRALTGLSAEQLDAVVAHELGHILRFDVAVNFLQVIAETLLFFHPAVWWLNKRIRADREDCCDDIAVAASGSRIVYARALAAMEGWRETPNFAMAATGGTVAARVARLLGRSEREERASRAIAAVLVLSMALAAGVVSLGVALPAIAQSTEPGTPPVAPAPAVPAPEMVPPSPPVHQPKVLPPVPVVPEAPVPELDAPPPPPPVPVAPPAEPARAAAPMRESTDPTDATEPVEPTAAKEPKVPKAPKPVKEPKAAKEPKVAKEPKTPKEPKIPKEPKADRTAVVSRDEQVEVRSEVKVDTREEVNVQVEQVHNVNINQSHNQNRNQNRNNSTQIDSGFDYTNPETILFMKNSDVTSDYIRAMLATGLHAQLDDLIALRSQNVSPEYVTRMRALGIDGGPRELVALKAQDVTPDYLQALLDAGVQAGARDAITARAMGITPEGLAHLRDLGVGNLTIDKLIQLKINNAL